MFYNNNRMIKTIIYIRSRANGKRRRNLCVAFIFLSGAEGGGRDADGTEH